MGGIMSRRVAALIVTVVLMAAPSVLAEKTLTATEAKDHIGGQATVCGKVVSTRYAESSRGSPTFLNFDQPYPNQVFTLLIWGSDRSKFGDPETSYRGKRICVTGKISDYKGVPEIVANAPSQVKAQ
jgi:DNA/RNA endonuclease YhcR with UshA esterase domain